MVAYPNIGSGVLAKLQYNGMQNLNHYKADLPGGGHVVVIDPGASLNAEALAMLQALHSRSVGGVASHLEVLAEKGADKFMSTYYVGYGHKSIGDCGSAVVFIEGISMLAAKAIQDYKLYNGQEASTRYIDFTHQAFLNPLDSKEGETILENWRTFYLKAVEEMKVALKERYPLGEGEKETTYDKAIAARAFDICRGFLPAGASTNIAWSGTLRQFADRVAQLRHHPLKEVRNIADALEDGLIARYPNSFDATKKRYDATEAYVAETMKQYYYHDANCPDLDLVRDSVDKAALAPYKELLSSRPVKTELPKWLGAYGEVAFAYQLDFGSFRDIQRHRAVTQRMPLLTADLGFNSWYLEELTESLRSEAKTLTASQKAAILALDTDDTTRQYYLAMGYNISNYLSGDLPAITYLIELRSTSFVHPTLVKQVVKMAKVIEEKLGDTGLVLHLDPEPGRFNVKRGEHDITKVN